MVRKASRSSSRSKPKPKTRSRSGSRSQPKKTTGKKKEPKSIFSSTKKPSTRSSTQKNTGYTVKDKKPAPTLAKPGSKAVAKPIAKPTSLAAQPTSVSAKTGQIPVKSNPFSSTPKAGTPGLDAFIKADTKKTGSYAVAGLAKNKLAITQSAMANGATRKENAALLAIANMETQDMSSKYKFGDGKGGDSACFSPYKLNKSMIKEAVKDGKLDPKYLNNPGALNDPNNLKDASGIMLHLMRKHGMNKFIDYHRGGTSGLNGNMDRSMIDDYQRGFKNVLNQYLSNPDLMTNDQRVEGWVKAI